MYLDYRKDILIKQLVDNGGTYQKKGDQERVYLSKFDNDSFIVAYDNASVKLNDDQRRSEIYIDLKTLEVVVNVKTLHIALSQKEQVYQDNIAKSLQVSVADHVSKWLNGFVPHWTILKSEQDAKVAKIKLTQETAKIAKKVSVYKNEMDRYLSGERIAKTPLDSVKKYYEMADYVAANANNQIKLSRNNSILSILSQNHGVIDPAKMALNYYQGHKDKFDNDKFVRNNYNSLSHSNELGDINLNKVAQAHIKRAKTLKKTTNVLQGIHKNRRMDPAKKAHMLLVAQADNQKAKKMEEWSVTEGTRLAILESIKKNNPKAKVRILGTSAKEPAFSHKFIEGKTFTIDEAMYHLTRIGCKHTFMIL